MFRKPDQTYGAVWATWSGEQAIQATNTFHPFSEIRARIVFTNWNHINSPIAEEYLDAGFKVCLNVNGFQQGETASYSNLDLATWQRDCSILINSFSQPEDMLLACFNEEANENYSIITKPSDMENYVQALSILTRTAYNKKIIASNGGLTTNALVYTTYRYLSDMKSADTTDFMAYCVPLNRQNGLIKRNSEGIEQLIANAQYLLNNYDTIPVKYLPYISIHMYFPVAKRLTDTATNWNNTYTGIAQITRMIHHYVHDNRQLITNEMGLLVENKALIENVVHDLKVNGFKHVIYLSNPEEEGSSLPLARQPHNPTTMGDKYLNAIKN